MSNRVRNPVARFFVQKGAMHWFILGALIAVVCVRPAFYISPSADEELKREVWSEFTIAFTIAFIVIAGAWTLCGALVGAIIFIVFRRRPKHEHFTRALHSAPDPPGFRGPKTMAEVNIIPRVIVLALVTHLLLYLFLLPLATRFYRLKAISGATPFIGTTVFAVLATVAIVPKAMQKFERWLRQMGQIS